MSVSTAIEINNDSNLTKIGDTKLSQHDASLNLDTHCLERLIKFFFMAGKHL